MEQSVVAKETQALERVVALQEELERLIAEAKRRTAEPPQPVAIQINLHDEFDRPRYPVHRGGLLQSKLFLATVVLAVTLGSAYARTRYVCQSFKQTNKFYYGMSIDRCVGTLIETPLASMEQQLARLNASY